MEIRTWIDKLGVDNNGTELYSICGYGTELYSICGYGTKLCIVTIYFVEQVLLFGKKCLIPILLFYFHF